MNTVRAAPVHPKAAKVPPVLAVPVPSRETGIDNFLHLMRRELAEPLGRIAELAGRMEELRNAGYMPATLSGQQVFSELADTSRRSAIIIRRLLDLGEVLVGPPLLIDERILLADSLRHAASQLAEEARMRGVGFRLDDNRQNLAPVYGSTHWIGVSLHTLLGMLVNIAPPGTYLQLRLRQVGYHQLLTVGISHGQPSAQTIDLLKGVPTQPKTALATAASREALDLVLVQAIIELHGGALKSDIAADGVFGEFHLTLPTGEAHAMKRHADCGHCPFVQQVEQFAHDIGELLKAEAPGQSEFTIYDKGSRK